MTNTIQDDVLLYSHSMNNQQGGLGGQHVPHDDVSVLRIRIPVVRDEEEEEHTVTPYQEEYYSQEYDGEYDPFDDLDNHYACLDYFELLRKARLQLMTDPQTDTDPFDIFSPITVINDYD